jgi:hypothetical protein
MSAPKAESTTFDEGIDQISSEPVIWVRVAAAGKDHDQWNARLLELTSGAAPPSWRDQAWEYPSARFAAMTESGETVADWLRSSKLPFGSNEIKLPPMTPSLRWERRQSHSPAPYEPLDWPSIETTLASVDASQGEPQGHLVSASDSPSFLNFYAAAAFFFWLDRQPVGGQLHQGVMYRHQDLRARLNTVRISEEEVLVEVERRGPREMIVELAGDRPGPTRRLPDDATPSVETVRFPLPKGLPPATWVLLRCEEEWLDRRFLSVPWGRGLEAGVEYVVEPQTKLEAFLANREGPQAEFKRQVPSNDEGKAKVMKTVCAYANGEGGSILFGIDDDHRVVGVAAKAVDRLKDHLTQMIGSWVEPRPRVDFDILPINDTDQVVLELWVEPGTGLYGCGRATEVRTPYIRHLATTVRARPAEIESIVRSRPSSGNSLGPLARR